MSRRYNRHGFQNFGGRKTGQQGAMDPSDIESLQWIQDYLNANAYLSVETFDTLLKPMGSIIRYSLRHHGLLLEYNDSRTKERCLGLTPKAGVLLKMQAVNL